MRRLSTVSVLLLSIACRSTVKPSAPMSFEAQEPLPWKAAPIGLGDGYSCMADKKGEGLCLGENNRESPAVWQSLKAANSTPSVRALMARSTVTCGIGVKPASLENRVLCWQPQTARAPLRAENDAILLSPKNGLRLKALALQKDQVCALQNDGSISCGPLTASNPNLKLNPLKSLKAIRSLHSGESFTCALRDDTGAIFCWGDNSKAQLGLGGALVADQEPVAIAGFSGAAVVMETGSRHVCAINETGEVFCWGDNSDQQLGVDNIELKRSASPQLVRGLPAKARFLALGDRHSCAQLEDGSVWCWGAAGRIGSDAPGGLIPMRVPLPVASAIIVAGLDRSCSQLTTGEFFCWGKNPGETNGSIDPEVMPVPR